jgi:methylmalonyl-CoA/ethylmalonyl-CoA epimerase
VAENDVVTAPAASTRAVLDHVAIGASVLDDGWALFCRLLGGRWAYGGDARGYWWGQLKFASGPKIELLRPTAGPDAAFLERFLTARGAGPHHFNFIVPDIVESLERVRALGIDPVQVNLDNPQWKEAFLHPKNAYGIVVQIAQQAVEPVTPVPSELPDPGPAATFAVVEHHVDDLDGAVQLFGDALNGQQVDDPTGFASNTVLLEWDNGARLRLVPADAAGLHHVAFTRADAPFTPAERTEIDRLASALGVSIELQEP